MDRSNRPLILISNDDGLDYPGIRTLIDIALPLGEVVVAAPMEHQSGMSCAITIQQPLMVYREKQAQYTAWRVTGTPVDCVKLAMDQLLGGRRPQLMLSGINHGYNAGISSIYSGTMGATFEASLRHIPAIAFSHGSISRHIDFTSCVPYIRDIIERALRNPDALKDVCLNVNFPHDIDRFKGVKITTTARGHWENEYDHRIDPHGRDYYWLQGRYVSDNPDDHTTDFYWLRQGWITVTPCQVDQTAPQAINDIQSLLNA